MLEKEKSNFRRLLEGLGFTLTKEKAEDKGRPLPMIWERDLRAKEPTRRKKGTPAEKQAAFPTTSAARAQLRKPIRHQVWKQTYWRVQEKNGSLSTQELRLVLDEGLLRDEIERLAKAHFGVRVRVEIADGDHGESWCLFEFVRAGDKTTQFIEEQPREMSMHPKFPPIGLGGFAFRFFDQEGALGLALDGHFGVGVLPTAFGERLHTLLRDALLGCVSTSPRASKFISLHEVELSGSHIADLLGPGSEAERASRIDSDEWQNYLAPSIQRGNWIVQKTKTTWQLTLTAAKRESKEIGATMPADKGVSMAILEAREVGQTLGYIDELLADGKGDLALEACLRELKASPTSQFLLRRLCLLALAADTEAHLIKEQRASLLLKGLEFDPQDLLFLSAAINIRLLRSNSSIDAATGEPSELIALISRLGARLFDRVQGSDGLASFEVVLPEILGDAWGVVDPSRAQECYERIVERRGELPRVLWKMVALCRRSGNEADEYQQLLRLLKCEQRDNDLAQVHLRLAQIVHSKDTKDEASVAHALKALEHDPSLGIAAGFVATVLEVQMKFDRAISLLDKFLRSNREILSPEEQSRIELRIGDLWNNRLARPDLAEVRYRSAARILPDNLEPLHRLRDLLRTQNRHDALASIYEEIIRIHEVNNNKAALRESFESLVRVLKLGKDGARLGEIFRRVAKNLLLTCDEIDDILSFPSEDGEIQWREIMDSLKEHLQKIDSGRERAEYLARLGVLARDKLRDHVEARSYFVDAVRDGFIADNDFHYLQDELLRLRKFEELSTVLEKYATFAPPRQGKQALIDLLALPEVVSEVRKDHVAVRAYTLDLESELVVHQRLQSYKRSGYADGLQRMLDLLLKEQLSGYKKEYWIRRVIDHLQEIHDSERFTSLDMAFRSLLEVTTDRGEALSDAILSFRDGERPDSLHFFLKLTIEEGKIPPLESKIIEEIFKDSPLTVGRYYLNVANQTSDQQRALELARTALEIFQGYPNEVVGLENALALICIKGESVESELQRLRNIVSQSGHWDLLAKALRQFVSRAELKDKRLPLLKELGNLQLNALGKPEDAKATFEEGLSLVPTDSEIYWLLARTASIMGDENSEKDRLLSFLSMVSRFDDFSRLTETIRRIESIKGTEVNLFLQLCKLVFPAIDQNQPDVLAYLTSKIMYMTGVASHARVNQFLEIGKALSASSIFHSNALVFYKEAMRIDSEDDRIWLPLYFLLRESGSIEERLQHLRMIIPPLEQDRKPLKTFPITLETLKRDLDELERDNSSPMPLSQAAGDGYNPFKGDRDSSAQRLKSILSDDALPPESHLEDDEFHGENWRDAISKPQLEFSEAEAFLERAFTNDLEKHVAVQALAVRTGNQRALREWNWRVWGSPQDIPYPLDAKGRLPLSGVTPEAVKSPLGTLILKIAPVLLRKFPDAFGKAGIAKRAGVPGGAIGTRRVKINLRSPELRSLGTQVLADRFERNNIRLFSLTGLNRQVTFDSEGRALYFDLDYCRDEKNSNLLHRLLQAYWSLKLQYFVPMALDPIREVFPVLLQIRQYIMGEGLGRMKAAWALGLTEACPVVAGMNQELLRDLYQKVGAIEQKSLISTWEGMQIHLCRIDMADTLDIVGLLSEITRLDVTSMSDERLQEIVDSTPEILDLVVFCARLKLD